MKTINTVHIKNTVMLASMLALVSSVFSASDSTDHVTYHPEGAAWASAVNKTQPNT